jgi:hypothetical protein
MRRYHYLLILFLTFTFLHGSAQSNIQWAIGLGNGKASNAYNTKLVFDSQKNVYMMGRYTDSTDFDPSLASMKKLVGDGISPFIAKYDVSGNYKWVKAIKYTYPNFIEISDILMDSHDEFYIYGSFAGAIDFDPSGNSDTLRTDTLLQGNCFIAKYDASGNYQRFRLVSGPLVFCIKDDWQTALPALFIFIVIILFVYQLPAPLFSHIFHPSKILNHLINGQH